MKIAKPLLLVTTPLGLIDGFYECYRLAGGLLFLMVAMVGVVGVGFATVIATIRREEREHASRPPGPGAGPQMSPEMGPKIGPGAAR
jgi:hypothetical protein